MTDRVFVDTNVLLYRFSEATPEKRRAAELWFAALWEADAGVLSWQVIFEFYANATRNAAAGTQLAREAVNQLTRWNPVVPASSLIQRAWHWCDAAQINFWDALIVAAAERSGCRYLLSEDFQAGRRFGSVTVVNPFEQPPSVFANLRQR